MHWLHQIDMYLWSIESSASVVAVFSGWRCHIRSMCLLKEARRSIHRRNKSGRKCVQTLSSFPMNIQQRDEREREKKEQTWQVAKHVFHMTISNTPASSCAIIHRLIFKWHWFHIICSWSRFEKWDPVCLIFTPETSIMENFVKILFCLSSIIILFRTLIVMNKYESNCSNSSKTNKIYKCKLYHLHYSRWMG